MLPTYKRSVFFNLSRQHVSLQRTASSDQLLRLFIYTHMPYITHISYVTSKYWDLRYFIIETFTCRIRVLKENVSLEYICCLKCINKLLLIAGHMMLFITAKQVLKNIKKILLFFYRSMLYNCKQFDFYQWLLSFWKSLKLLLNLVTLWYYLRKQTKL